MSSGRARAARLLFLLQGRHLRARGRVLTWWVRAWGGSVGRGLQVDKGVRLRHAPGPAWTIGDDVYLGVGVVLDVRHGAEFVLGTRVKIMHHVVVGAAESVRVGSHTQIAESSSVRDQDHDTTRGHLMIEAPVVTSPVVIGDDVWISRGAAILRGVHIADGAVVAANAVVRRDIPADTVAGGVPARELKTRPSE